MARVGKPIDHALRLRREADIRACALDVLTTQGYGGMRMDDVARLAGVSKAAIYLYFENKEALYKAVLRDLSGAITGQLEALRVQEDLDYPARLGKTLDVLYAAMLESPVGCLMPVVSETARQHPALARFFLEAVRGPLDRELLALMAAGVKDGAFVDHPITRSVPLLVGPILAMAFQQSLAASLNAPPSLDIEAIKRAHLSHLLGTLSPRG